MKENQKGGYIYVLTNPSFNEWIKIGFAKDVDARVRQLNRTECTPFGFRVYATYKVNTELTDKKVHAIIDKLNPDLRSKDTIKGKERVREFYAMSPESAYELLYAIAEINGMEKNVTLVKASKDEQSQAKEAEEVENNDKRNANFRFSMCNLKPGDKVEFIRDANIKATIVDDKRVEYNGQTMTLTALARLLTGITRALAGPTYFTYKGTPLNELRVKNGFELKKAYKKR